MLTPGRLEQIPSSMRRDLLQIPTAWALQGSLWESTHTETNTLPWQLIALAPGWVSAGCHPVPVATKPSIAGRQR